MVPPHLTFIRVRMRWRSARPSCWKHALMRDGGRALPCGTCRALLPGKDFEKIGALKRTLRLLQVVRQRAAPDRGRAPLPYEVCALWGHPHLPFIRVCRWWRSARPQGRSGAARRLCEPCSGRGGSVGDFTRRCAGYERNGGQNAHPTLARFACLLRYRISNLWRQLRHCIMNKLLTQRSQFIPFFSVKSRHHSGAAAPFGPGLLLNKISCVVSFSVLTNYRAHRKISDQELEKICIGGIFRHALAPNFVPDRATRNAT